MNFCNSQLHKGEGHNGRQVVKVVSKEEDIFLSMRIIRWEWNVYKVGMMSLHPTQKNQINCWWEQTLMLTQNFHNAVWWNMKGSQGQVQSTPTPTPPPTNMLLHAPLPDTGQVVSVCKEAKSDRMTKLESGNSPGCGADSLKPSCPTRHIWVKKMLPHPWARHTTVSGKDGVQPRSDGTMCPSRALGLQCPHPLWGDTR